MDLTIVPETSEGQVAEGTLGKCSTCGHEMSFVPGTGEVECVSCKRKESAVTGDESVKLPLTEEALSMPPAPLGNVVTKCASCGAESVIPSGYEHGECSWCGSALLKRIENFATGHKPNGIIPFVLSSDEAFGKLKEWVSGLWFAPNALKKMALKNDLRGAYVPFWLFDAMSSTRYRGERGNYRWETRTRTVTKDGQTTVETYQERVTDWYPASGTVANRFVDVSVPAQKEIPYSLLDELGTWSTNSALKAESAQKMLLGFEVMSATISLKSARSTARSFMTPAIERKIRSDIGGDEQRISEYSVSWRDEKFSHTLCPIWVGTYRFGDRMYRVSVNGQHGTVDAERPWSSAKIVMLGMLIGTAVVAGVAAVDPDFMTSLTDYAASAWLTLRGVFGR